MNNVVTRFRLRRRDEGEGNEKTNARKTQPILRVRRRALRQRAKGTPPPEVEASASFPWQLGFRGLARVARFHFRAAHGTAAATFDGAVRMA